MRVDLVHFIFNSTIIAVDAAMHQFIRSNFGFHCFPAQFSLRFERLGHLADCLDALLYQFGLKLLLAADEEEMGLHVGESLLHLFAFGDESGLGCGLYSISFWFVLAGNTYMVVSVTLLVFRLILVLIFGLNTVGEGRRDEKEFLLFLALVGRVHDLVSGELDFPVRRQLVSVGAELLVVRSVDGGEEDPGRVVDAIDTRRQATQLQILVGRTKGDVRRDA